MLFIINPNELGVFVLEYSIVTFINNSIANSYSENTGGLIIDFYDKINLNFLQEYLV